MTEFLRKIRKQIWRRAGDRRARGFTLIEVLIAASIFTTVSLISLNIFVNVIRTQRRVSLDNAMYEDARVMMERIAREVRSNTIDYEEYYNKATLKTNPYGNRYGCYAKRFYNPGGDGLEGGKFGALCAEFPFDPVENPDCVIDKTTLDINTGQNPFTGFIPDVNGDSKNANAFCDFTFGDEKCAADKNRNVQDQLYLINAKGKEKTILALKNTSNDVHPEHALALLRLSGQDKDQDGVVEVWKGCVNTNELCCSTGFDCNLGMEKLEDTLNYKADEFYKGFVPISPRRTDVVSVKFLIAPLEDPRKAFAETDAALQIQQQPHVTILLTVRPSKEAMAGFGGAVSQLTLQTTITSRVYNEVKSYYTVGKDKSVCKDY